MLAISRSSLRSDATPFPAVRRKVDITTEPIPRDELDDDFGGDEADDVDDAPPPRRGGRTRSDDFDDTPPTRGGAGPQNPNTLRAGSRGAVVYELQEILGIDETGVYDAQTEAAVRKFQRENGMEADGWVGSATAELLGLALERDANEPTEPSNTGNWDDDVQPTNPSTLRRGSTGNAVKAAQRKLGVRVTGTYDAATEAAVRRFQSQRRLDADGWVGQQTASALGIELEGGLSPDVDPDRPSRGGPAELHASIDEYKKKGSRSQMIIGRITINGRTYKYRSGGHGRGNLPPGRYTLTPHIWNRQDKPSMKVGGVGFSFALSDKRDPRVGGTRGALRIHPDGGTQGTIGCIGIIGNAETMRRFRDDMRAVFKRRGNSVTLTVG